MSGGKPPRSHTWFQTALGWLLLYVTLGSTYPRQQRGWLTLLRSIVKILIGPKFLTSHAGILPLHTDKYLKLARLLSS
ncbi:Hypothetical protein RMP42_05818 [Roseomonas mucosa]|nr:Hypothetical protein RMP42_05818 [Roseomonas mucosa]